MLEFMMRSMKMWLRKLLGQSRIFYEQLHMMLAEIKTVINDTF